jgi:hypothetical protein
MRSNAIIIAANAEGDAGPDALPDALGAVIQLALAGAECDCPAL